MTWLLLLTKLKTFWSKGKYYISIALVGAAAIFIFFVLKKKDKAWEMVQKIKDNHNKELDIINKSHKEVSEKKRKEVEKYHKIIKEIETLLLDGKFTKEVERFMLTEARTNLTYAEKHLNGFLQVDKNNAH